MVPLGGTGPRDGVTAVRHDAGNALPMQSRPEVAQPRRADPRLRPSCRLAQRRRPTVRHHSAVPPIEIRPMRSLGLLSVAHAINHAQAVLLPLIFLAIIDEFGVGVETIAFLAAIGAFAAGHGPAELRRPDPARLAAAAAWASAGSCSAAGSRPRRSRRASLTFAIPNVVSRIGGSPQHPGRQRPAGRAVPARASRVRDQRPHRGRQRRHGGRRADRRRR